VESAINGAAETVGGQVSEIGGSKVFEYVFSELPYVGIVVDCAGQLQASEDALTALLENYINFGANQWNKANGSEYRDALVWSPMARTELDQEFLDNALLLQSFLNDYGLAGNSNCAGMYWDEILVQHEEVQKYNEEHPENKKQSKLDEVKWIVTKTTNPAFKDYTNEVILPIGRIPIESWVTIYFGDAWGMQY
jgi:hypothetical protein